MEANSSAKMSLDTAGVSPNQRRKKSMLETTDILQRRNLDSYATDRHLLSLVRRVLLASVLKTRASAITQTQACMKRAIILVTKLLATVLVSLGPRSVRSTIATTMQIEISQLQETVPQQQSSTKVHQEDLSLWLWIKLPLLASMTLTKALAKRLRI